MGRRDKTHYHVVRKNRADTKALFRAVACAYLLYLAWDLIRSGGSVPSFPPLTARLLGGLFILAALAFGRYTWREYRQALKEAELTPREEAELRRERGEE